MANFAQFSQQLRKEAGVTDGGAAVGDDLVKKIANDLVEAITQQPRHPVITGRLIGSWHLTVGAPSGGPVGSPEGRDAAGEARAAMSDFKMGDTVYIQNHAERNNYVYASDVEFGQNNNPIPRMMMSDAVEEIAARYNLGRS